MPKPLDIAAVVAEVNRHAWWPVTRKCNCGMPVEDATAALTHQVEVALRLGMVAALREVGDLDQYLPSKKPLKSGEEPQPLPITVSRAEVLAILRAIP